ncbi:hypothetical protein SAMN05444406_11042 [Caldicoprobacter faecalis]|uniref:Uncharacterized protein n=1 Tax=Caldicoprobacter faecalis TaxID=937334 RepID=A0A1I5V8Q7_9FIRM|nr:hypothetical protein SAMN05444406_11042 [Caldicoprobacter faecalis]
MDAGPSNLPKSINEIGYRGGGAFYCLCFPFNKNLNMFWH